MRRVAGSPHAHKLTVSTQIGMFGAVPMTLRQTGSCAHIGGYRALGPRPTVTLRNDSRRLPEPHVRYFLIDLSHATFRRQII
jgi:hypothetical protein